MSHNLKVLGSTPRAGQKISFTLNKFINNHSTVENLPCKAILIDMLVVIFVQICLNKHRLVWIKSGALNMGRLGGLVPLC